MGKVWENPHAEFLKDVVGVVKATSTEKFYLWKEYHNSLELFTWKEGGGGPMVTIGHVGDMPVCICLLVDVVEGHRILFVDATSQVVDWRMVDEWLKKHLPQSAYNERGYINETDAFNFVNVLPTRSYPSTEKCEHPPEGWSCSRGKGHKGPCAATPLKPVGMQSSLTLHSSNCNRRTNGTFCDCGVS